MARIGIIASLFAPNGRLFEGGAERHTFRLAQVASELGADVTVYQPGNAEARFVVEGLDVHSIVSTPRKIWLHGTRRALDNGCRRVHYQYLGHVPALARHLHATATHHAIYWDIPLDREFRAWYPHGRAANIYLRPWRRLQKAKYFASLRRCKDVLADDTTLLRLVQSDSPELRNRITVVPNFYDLTPGPSSPECVVATIEEAKKAGHLIVFVPRNLTLKQGIHFIPGLVELCLAGSGPKCHFFVAGRYLQHLPGWQDYEKALQGGFASLSSEARKLLTLLDGVSHDCMAYCYAASDIVLLPSFASEGMPLSALEAMAFGRAVVATNIGGLNDVIDDGLNGLLVKPSIESLANGVQRLAADPQLRRQLGEEARHKADRCFSLRVWKDSAGEFMRRNGWFA